MHSRLVARSCGSIWSTAFKKLSALLESFPTYLVARVCDRAGGHELARNDELGMVNHHKRHSLLLQGFRSRHVRKFQAHEAWITHEAAVRCAVRE